MRYERKVHDRLLERFGSHYIPGQWWNYLLPDGSAKFCQTDGLLLDDAHKQLTLVEVKLSHTVDAYWQIENVYYPVLACFLRASDWKIATVEVVKWYDPATRYPRPCVLKDELTEVRPGEFAVHILNR